MKISGTEWYTAARSKLQSDSQDVGLPPPVFLTYRCSVENQTEEQIQAKQAELAAKGIKTKLKQSKYDHTGIPAGTPFLQIADEESVANIEKLWGLMGLELDAHRFDEYKKLKWNSFFAWDIVSVQHRDGSFGPAYRINLDKLTEEQRVKLDARLKELGVRGTERNSSSYSEHVKPGDLTFRVSDPDSIQKLNNLFVDKPDPKQDWRNLYNWDNSKKAYNHVGLPIPNLALNVSTMSEKQLKHLNETLRAWGIKYGLRTASQASNTIKVGDRYLCVDGISQIEKLEILTAPWQKRNIIKTPENVQGGR